MEVKINETFTSIQGESSDIGKPCFFIRLHGCNLNCSYCDTNYAKEDSPDAYEVMNVDLVIREALNSMCRTICITGGEPLLQMDAVHKMCEEFIHEGKTVSIETNGTIPLSSFANRDVCFSRGLIKLIMDIKCPSAGKNNMGDEKIIADNVRALRWCDEIKFVISDLKDFEYAKGWCRWLSGEQSVFNGSIKTPGHILFSPNWDSMKPSQLVDMILNDSELKGANIRFQLQLHKVIWGNERCR